MAEVSSRQHALADQLAKAARSGGRRHNLDDRDDTGDKAVFNDEQVARTVAKVYEWVRTGHEPAPQEPAFAWLAVATHLRVMFAGPSDPPEITPAQLTELVRNGFERAAGIPPRSAAVSYPPEEFAAWHAAAIHGYNCVLADAPAIRENPLAERERMIVAQARDAMGQLPR